MQEKYLVEITSSDGSVRTKSYKTRKQIVDMYEIPLYIVDKLIKVSNDPSFTSKRKGHKIFQETFDTMKILFIKPKVTSD